MRDISYNEEGIEIIEESIKKTLDYFNVLDYSTNYEIDAEYMIKEAKKEMFLSAFGVDCVFD